MIVHSVCYQNLLHQLLLNGGRVMKHELAFYWMISQISWNRTQSCSWSFTIFAVIDTDMAKTSNLNNRSSRFSVILIVVILFILNHFPNGIEGVLEGGVRTAKATKMRVLHKSNYVIEFAQKNVTWKMFSFRAVLYIYPTIDH